MKTYIARTTGDASHDYTNESSKKKGNIDSPHQFADNRTEAIAQRKLQQLANNSQQAEKNEQVQTMADLHMSQQKPTLRRKKNNTGMPDKLKTGIEDLSGYSMDDVNVHYNSNHPAQLNAHAYAQGTDIYVAPGQEKHLPHEAWHVVQQKQGRVAPTMQLQGINVNDNAGLEKEADVMGGNALNGSQKIEPDNLKNGKALNKGSIQRKGVKSELIASHINFENFKEETEEIAGHVSEISKAIYNEYKPPKHSSFNIETEQEEEYIDKSQDITNKNNRTKNGGIEVAARDHAIRLNHWSRNAVIASSRLFAELRGAVDITGKGKLDTIKFGTDTDKEPDVMTQSLHDQSSIGRAIESKQISSGSQGAVDEHVTKGFKQLIKRTANQYILYLEIVDQRNPWPYTPVALQKMIDKGEAPDPSKIIETGKARALKYGNHDAQLDRTITVVLNSNNSYIGRQEFTVS